MVATRPSGAALAETIYDELLRLGQDLLQFNGFLDTQEQQAQLKARTSFQAARNKIVYDLLQRGLDADAATEVVVSDFTAIRADTPDYYASVVDYVQTELVTRIEREARKSPLRRRAVKWAPAAIAVMVIALYFGLRLYSVTPIDRPLDTRVGLAQRAAAFTKVMRHQAWTETRRNGAVVGLLMWPIAPTEAEISGASEFAGLAVGARAALARERAICGAPADRATLDDADLTLIAGVADAIRQPDVKWLSPPAYTLLPPIQKAYPCR